MIKGRGTKKEIGDLINQLKDILVLFQDGAIGLLVFLSFFLSFFGFSLMGIGVKSSFIFIFPF